MNQLYSGGKKQAFAGNIKIDKNINFDMKVHNKRLLLILILTSFCAFALMPQNVLALKKRKPVDVEIKSYDGFKLIGTLDIPDYASTETKAPLVIFLHSICQDHRAWGEFPREIKESLNVATLNLDLRGHGRSIRDKKDKLSHWQNLHSEDYKKMPEDILQVLEFIKKDYPEIDNKKIAIIGSSLGATVGLMASSYKEDIDAVVMFSPMMEYKGFDLRLPIVKYGNNPLMFLVSKKDVYAYKSCEELIKFPQGVKHLEVYPDGGHGEDLLKFRPESAMLVTKWLKDNFYSEAITVKKLEQKQNENFKKFRYKKVGEYFGKIKTDRDLHGSIRER